MDELLTSVSPQLVDEFADEFFAKRGRKILHDSRRWRVLDTWNGDPTEHFRYNVHPKSTLHHNSILDYCLLQAETETSTAEYSLFRVKRGSVYSS